VTVGVDLSSHRISSRLKIPRFIFILSIKSFVVSLTFVVEPKLINRNQGMSRRG